MKNQGMYDHQMELAHRRAIRAQRKLHQRQQAGQISLYDYLSHLDACEAVSAFQNASQQPGERLPREDEQGD